MRADDPTVTAHEPTEHLSHPDWGWLAAACGAQPGMERISEPNHVGMVTCGSCKRTKAYKRAWATREERTSRLVAGEPATSTPRAVAVAAQPLSGIPLRPLACLACGGDADEVNLSVNVSEVDGQGCYVPGGTEYGSTLSDRIGTSCPDCGITLDDSWPLAVLAFVGKQNGEAL